jgi:glycosyltransferase involved in cell wall biosynthesis
LLYKPPLFPGYAGGCIKISIVTNAYNQGQFLAEAMQSVLSQDWPEIEYLVVDPGSTDNTAEIIRAFQQKYPSRVIHISGRDNGPADGLNRAFAKATGDLFGYLNADDWYLPGCFRKVIGAANKNPDAAAIYADGYQADSNGKILRRIISTSFSSKKFVYGGALVLQQSTFYRATAFRTIGGFNKENRTSWDAELLLDMSIRRMRLVHVSGFWSVFRIHPDSITGSQRLAEESRRTHSRYFKTVTGRDKKLPDRLARNVVLGYTLLTEPRGLVARVSDRLRRTSKKSKSASESTFKTTL